ncbi:MAG: hypothetical protein QNJ68_21945 [Microcoleaceae cyanobacterium MO_207.B10]|nr:hypothetical protein [Microcoleaceae cyanobacterium MO_207.B10]
MKSSLSVPENISDQEASALTQEIMSGMETGQLSEAETEALITKLVKSKDGARGFFISYLTDSRPLADNPSPLIFRALESAPDTVPELLAKNLAMSSVMIVYHQQNQNEETARGSAKVRSRTINLIKNLNLPVIHKILQELYRSVTTGEGNYKEFLERFGYDTQQRQVIAEALQPLID